MEEEVIIVHSGMHGMMKFPDGTEVPTKLHERTIQKLKALCAAEGYTSYRLRIYAGDLLTVNEHEAIIWEVKTSQYSAHPLTEAVGQLLYYRHMMNDDGRLKGKRIRLVIAVPFERDSPSEESLLNLQRQLLPFLKSPPLIRFQIDLVGVEMTEEEFNPCNAFFKRTSSKNADYPLDKV